MQTTSYSLQRQEKQDVSHIKNILDNKSLTFAEKVISIKNIETRNKFQTLSVAGDIVIVDVDLAMAQDSTGHLAIRSFNEMGIDKLHNPSPAKVEFVSP